MARRRLVLAHAGAQAMVVGRVAGGRRQPRGPNAAPGACGRACHGFEGRGPAAPNCTLRSRCAHSGSGLFWLDPPAVGERASQKSSLGLLWAGRGAAGRRRLVAGHGDGPGGSAQWRGLPFGNALAAGGVGQWSITWSWSGTWVVIQKSERSAITRK